MHNCQVNNMKGLKGNISKKNVDKQIAFAKEIINEDNFIINNNIGNKWLFFAAEAGNHTAQAQVRIQYNQNDYTQARELFISSNANIRTLCDIAFLLYMVKQEIYDTWFDIVIKYHKEEILKECVKYPIN